MTKTVLEAFLSMQPRANDPEVVHLMTDPDMRAKIIMQILRWPAVALPDVENPVVVAGAAMDDEIVELWMVAGEGFDQRKNLKLVLKQLRQLIATAEEAFPTRKIKLQVNPDRPGAEKFVQRLGFIYEKRKAAHVYTLKQEKK
ncbi:MAG: hypothetical protein ACK502_10755 [Alphaproteobacteria bacterium]